MFKTVKTGKAVLSLFHISAE